VRRGGGAVRLASGFGNGARGSRRPGEGGAWERMGRGRHQGVDHVLPCREALEEGEGVLSRGEALEEGGEGVLPRCEPLEEGDEVLA
jgi:hypothetical protein